MPALEGDEVERAVGRVHAAEQAEPAHPRVVLDAGCRLQDRVELVVHRRRALERGREGELDVEIEVPLVLVGDEAAGQP